MFCRNCGAEQPDGAGFCSRCGAPLRDAPVRSDRRREAHAGGFRRFPEGLGISAAVFGILALLLCGLAFLPRGEGEAFYWNEYIRIDLKQGFVLMAAYLLTGILGFVVKRGRALWTTLFPPAMMLFAVIWWFVDKSSWFGVNSAAYYHERRIMMLPYAVMVVLYYLLVLLTGTSKKVFGILFLIYSAVSTVGLLLIAIFRSIAEEGMPMGHSWEFRGAIVLFWLAYFLLGLGVFIHSLRERPRDPYGYPDPYRY